ncbi:MAG: DDE-type integrase/transposase/recombinase [Chitinivibrionales bacterium]|nr:DDE-type integrase/transposase/recombinase [Chitinivibrionales bacterium]
MAVDNPTWGAPRIHSELLLLGYRVALSTIARYIDRPNQPRGPELETVPPQPRLRNHASDTAALDLFTVPSATFKVLYALVVIRHHSRELVHVAATAHPSSEWLADQLLNAFPYDSSPSFLIRDRDSAYGTTFRRRLKNMEIRDVATSYKSPWQNCYAERIIGSVR